MLNKYWIEKRKEIGNRSKWFLATVKYLNENVLGYLACWMRWATKEINGELARIECYTIYKDKYYRVFKRWHDRPQMEVLKSEEISSLEYKEEIKNCNYQTWCTVAASAFCDAYKCPNIYWGPREEEYAPGHMLENIKSGEYNRGGWICEKTDRKEAIKLARKTLVFAITRDHIATLNGKEKSGQPIVINVGGKFGEMDIIEAWGRMDNNIKFVYFAKEGI